MRILIFAADNNPAAQELLTKKRSEGHHASMRNPQYFDGSLEPCSLVISDDAAVLTVYEAVKVETAQLSAKSISAVAVKVAAEAESEPESAPAKKAIKRK